jgi:hypothetical protein
LPLRLEIAVRALLPSASVTFVALVGCSSRTHDEAESSVVDPERVLVEDVRSTPKTILDTLATPPGGEGVDRAFRMVDADASLTGWSNVRAIGSNVGFVGDLDGDGHDDVVIAGAGPEPGSAAAYVVSGASLDGASGPSSRSCTRRSSSKTTKSIGRSSCRPGT